VKKKLPKRDEVRATYESRRLTHKEVSDLFIERGYSISYKTVEKWSADDKWNKDSCESFDIAMQNVEEQKIEENNFDDTVIETLGNINIVNELAMNLIGAKKIVEKSDTAQGRKIYQEMLLKIYDRTNNDGGIILEKAESSLTKPLEDMTMEELNQLIAT
jgi:hypothetical protein